ncbi:PepSY-associated TM helix domain-containing protein [Calothrix sp. NIES-3974]|uniref:PepSY-associated TM helix domain-containing protein n=1 Tax=Calothrix sp. NIES-3974 TaxID=2005462 RepID=UPI000B6203F4|nr:PepSY-associated TM helix domain-containing protein [Calothrix sp. NIES-3974]BAZ05641.1 peptidase [Calothrix sp. NIES-3974]
MRKQHPRIHRYIGILVGLFLAIITLTGSILVFSAEINSFVYPQIHHLTPNSTSISIQQTANIISEKFPGEKLHYINIPQKQDDAYQVVLQTAKIVYLNPYTGKILAVIDKNHFLGVIRQIHTNLLSGNFGEFLVGICGILLMTRVINGLSLWVGWKRLSAGFKIRFHAPKHLINYDFHQVIGVISVIFLIFMGITGTLMVFKQPVKYWGYQIMGIPQPELIASIPRVNKKLDLDEFITRANLALVDGKVTMLVAPTSETSPVIVRKRLAGDLNVNGKSYVYLDQYTGEILKIENLRKIPGIDKFLASLYPLHKGDYGGIVSKLIYFLFGFVPLFLFISGLAIFWHKSYGYAKKKSNKNKQ